jgi:DNA-binding NtrC family response regulator
MDRAAKPRILCVDDEPELLAALRLVLRRRFDVVTADSGGAGVDLIKARPFAAVMSDLRMPRMDGGTFLAQCRELAPHTVRLLLTGYADRTLLGAIDERAIFRILIKPCQPDAVVAALSAACERHYELVEGTP